MLDRNHGLGRTKTSQETLQDAAFVMHLHLALGVAQLTDFPFHPLGKHAKVTFRISLRCVHRGAVTTYGDENRIPGQHFALNCYLAQQDRARAAGIGHVCPPPKSHRAGLLNGVWPGRADHRLRTSYAGRRAPTTPLGENRAWTCNQ